MKVLERIRIVTPLIALASACGDELTAGPDRVRLDPDFVTGAAAAALGPDGRFALPDAVINPKDQLSEEQARKIASEYVTTFARFFRWRWVSEHGAPVEPSELQPCDRAVYTASAYSAIEGNASEITRRTLGPHWVVPMCGATRRLQIVVSFSALATEMATAPEPGKGRPWERTDFYSFGVPGDARTLFSPEGAAELAFKQSGKRVSKVPVLTMAPVPIPAVLLRWSVGVEAPVKVKGTESAVTRERTTLFAGFGETFYSSGLLDHKPQAALAAEPLVDPRTKDYIRPTVAPVAPANVELVTRETQ